MGREGKEEEGGERGRMIKVCVCEWESLGTRQKHYW